MARTTLVDVTLGGGRWRKRVLSGGRYADIDFEGFRITNAQLSDYRFERCSFKNSHVYDSTLVGSTWEECRFSGKYGSLGRNVTYVDCRFEDCRIQTVLFTNVHFVDCSFSGTIRHVLWQSTDAPLNRVVFERCDMTHARFEHVSAAYADLSSVRLPVESVRVFVRESGRLGAALEEAARAEDSISLRVLASYGHAEGGPIAVMDVAMLESMLETLLRGMPSNVWCVSMSEMHRRSSSPQEPTDRSVIWLARGAWGG
jgi:uncharacterized protein YjbI with pentapeptide repeats